MVAAPAAPCSCPLRDQINAAWRLIATYARINLVDAYWMDEAVDAILEGNEHFPYADLTAGGLELPPATGPLTLRLVECWHLIATHAHLIDPIWLKAVAEELKDENMGFVGAIGVLKERCGNAVEALALYEDYSNDEEDYLADCYEGEPLPLWAGPVEFIELIDGMTPAEIKRRRIEQLREDNDRCTASFSRACGICSNQSPPRRACFTTCGHLLCVPCAEQRNRDTQLTCPLCGEEGAAVRVFEDEDASISSRVSACKADETTFSRACAICDADRPRARACLSACGHLLCLACTLQIEQKGRVTCPMCREEGGWVEMREGEEEEEEEEEEKGEEEEEKEEEEEEEEEEKGEEKEEEEEKGKERGWLRTTTIKEEEMDVDSPYVIVRS